MGYYIAVPPGQHHGKAKWIVDNLNGIYIAGRPSPEQVTEGYVPVCVVDNGPFEAAAIAYNDKEARYFDQSEDTRPKQWLLVPITQVIKANVAVQPHINWNNTNATNKPE